jgi:Carboxypeptidase regulatory-like domain
MKRCFVTRVAQCAVPVFLMLVSSLQIFSQQTLGSINGTVLDPSGAAIPGASVTVTAADIGVTRTTTSQGNGFYQLFNLPIGTYVVKAEHDGFETTAVSGIHVQEAQASTVSIALKIGRASESVEVTANPLLNATDATNGYTLDSAEIQNAPLATGSFTQLAVLTPGVNAELLGGIGTNTGLGNQPIWANGQRDTSNTFQVNGVDVTNLFNGKSSSSATSLRINFNIGSGASGGVGATGGSATTSSSVYGSNGNALPAPPPEFLQEIRVNASMYDAQQGATSGAQVDANTYAGTNKMHGQAYGYESGNFINAAPYFFKQAYLLSQQGIGYFPQILENPAIHRWTAGGTLGGPLLKDKLFYFIGYQHTYTTDMTQGYSQVGVPTGLTDDRSAAGIMNALTSWNGGTPINNITIDPIASALLQAKLPNGQYMIPSAQTNEFNGGHNTTLLATTLFYADQANASLDYDLTKNDRLSGKYFYQHDPSANPFIISKVGGFPGNEDSGAQVAALDNAIAISPRINWEQRLGFVRMKVYSNFGQDVQTANGPTGGIAFPNATGLPGMSLDLFNCNSTAPGAKANQFCQNGTASSISAGPNGDFVNQGYFQNRINPSTNVIFALGKHTIVAGGGYSYTQLNIRNNRTGIGSITTKNFETFLQGKVAKSSMLASIGSDGRNYADRYYRTNEVSGYVQDKFQILTNLSLTYGLRYDYHGGFTEKYGNMFNFDPATYDVQGDTTTGFNVVNGGFVVAANNKYYPTPGVSESTLTGRQWGLSPRLGFAWAPKRDKGKIVWSGGAGMYYDRGEYFSYLSQPSGGGIGGPFGVTMAPPLGAQYSASNTTLANPMGSVVITPPNPNPAFFTNELQEVLSPNGGLMSCTSQNSTSGDGCYISPFYFGAYDRANKLPYSINYTLKFQWQPRYDTAITIGYAGNRGRHGVIPLPFNQPQIATPGSPSMILGKEPHSSGESQSYGYQVLDGSQPEYNCDSYGDTCFPGIPGENWNTYDGGNVDFRTPYPGYSPNAALFRAAGVSAYDSLESHIEKRLSHNFQLGASYTWGHSLDEQSDIGLFFTGDNPAHLRDSWASSDFDRTHVFSGNFVYQVPNAVREHNLLSYFTNDWKLGGIAILQSGQPFSLYEFYGAVASIYFGNYPNLANPVLPIKGSVKSALTGQNGAKRDNGGNYYPAIDPSQINIPTLQPGQMGIPACSGSAPCDDFETNFQPGQRNIFRQAFQKRLDLTLRKSFHIKERLVTEIQFNSFNVTNTTSLDIPQDQTQIGQASASFAPDTYPYYTPYAYGQVIALKGQEQAAFNNLYQLPQYTKSNGTVTSNSSNFGSVTNTIGSSRVFTGALHFTF